MEEKKTAKQVSLNPASEKESKSSAVNDRKATYEELNNYCLQLYNQNKQLSEQLKQRDMTNLFRRLDYLFMVVQNKDAFNADFVGDCTEEIQAALSIAEEESKAEE